MRFYRHADRHLLCAGSGAHFEEQFGYCLPDCEDLELPINQGEGNQIQGLIELYADGIGNFVSGYLNASSGMASVSGAGHVCLLLLLCC